MSQLKTLDHIGEIDGKRVLVRVDINVPIVNGIVSDKTRIERLELTISELSSKGAKVILLAHFGRPKGEVVAEISLSRVIPVLCEVFGKTVSFASDCRGEIAIHAIENMNNGDILLLENTRFHASEEKNCSSFSKELASLGDIFVNDAFSSAHRAHASTTGIANYLPSYAGRTMQAEIEALERGLGRPVHPVIAIIGGTKVATKIHMLAHLVSKVDYLVIGGGMANTFLSSIGVGVGTSFCEHHLGDMARSIMEKARTVGCEIILPTDVVVSDKFSSNSSHEIVVANAVGDKRMILDAGPVSVEIIANRIASSNTLIWNGPLGAFELKPFDHATIVTAECAASATQKGYLVSVAGGGDTVSALNHAGVSDRFTYVSTAGGAFLEWIEGKRLPSIALLKKEVHFHSERPGL
ncbi:phosphoglycerate kinase [Candidatus Endowatersipora endosymbiont of Watersipora subatra]|uniref:phosphoglycerate kinase n=1 Tax=Candidatus Endowatersipora endosymbiont of Watersipora subatra TaxID=3077946 RepID=UPI00312CA239